MFIRNAATGERAAILALVALYPKELVQELADIPATEDFSVAVEGAGIIGCCALDVYRPRLAEIRSLAVHPARTGSGIGRALVHACLARAHARGISRVLSITGNPRLFERFGFASFNEEKFAVFKILHNGPPSA